MSDAKIRAIVKRPDEKYGHVTNISCSLKNLQRIVDGPIECISCGTGAVIICNEEGKLRGLPRNIIVGKPPFIDMLVGEIAVVGVDGEDFCDCPLDFGVWKMMLEKWGN